MTSYSQLLAIIVMLVVAIGLAELLLGAVIKNANGRFPWLIIKGADKPRFPAKTLEKYFALSQDPALGWARKPGSKGEDPSPEGNAVFAIARDGSRQNPGFDDKPIVARVYGDSYAFCRLVNDDEAWPHHLSVLLGQNVANFGVGNYGLDQALLRFEAEASPSETEKYVILAVVPETIVRIHSQWKHFFEYGNILAFKPKFIIAEHSLEKIESPVKSIDDFQQISKIIERLKCTDPFYEEKFRKDILQRPYLLSVATKAKRTLGILGRLYFCFNNGREKALRLVLRENHRYQNKFYDDPNAVALLRQIVKRFAENLIETNVKPVLVVFPQPLDLAEKRKFGAAKYQNVFAEFSSMLRVIDLMDVFHAAGADQNIYKKGALGPHTNADMNRKIAEHLRAELYDND